MEPINVLVATPAFDRTTPRADEAILRQISQAAPGITVKDGSALIMAEFRGDAAAKDKLDALLAEADVIFGLILPRDLVKRAPRLKWVQAMSAGVDRLAQSDIWQSDVIITGVSGIHATVIGEFVMGLILQFAKGAAESFRMKQKHEWKRYATHTLRGKTAGIVGLGHIGQEVARLSRAFGMRVIATRRSTKQVRRARNVDVLYPPEQLNQLLAESDYVIICVPLTPQTQKLIGEKELNAMKSTAYIINIARGGIIDEAALVRALEEKRIAGAGLDVTTPEPLPPESRLWDMDNVILSPHVSGSMEDYTERSADIFCENLRRWRAGKKLVNVVDRKRGY
jgi:phosphoglycerate dehydrogenase-like enzyme